MLISHKQKIVFVHIPKTGGTSISTALQPLLGPGDFFEILHAPKHYTACQIRNTFFSTDLEWSSYLSFAIMRNPWERIYSDYCFSERMARVMRGGCPPELNGWVRKIRRVSQYPFEKFVREQYLADGKTTYQRWCQDDRGRDVLMFVGQFERLQQDWNRVCRLVGLPIGPLPHENRSRPTDASAEDYRQAYTPQLRVHAGDRSNLPERPERCFAPTKRAPIGPVLFSCSPHRLNGKPYHEQWLHNLMASTSLMGLRNSTPAIR